MADKIINGVNVTQLGENIKQIKADPELAKFKFHVQNKWVEGGYSKTEVKDFYGTKEKHRTDKSHHLEADEPPVLLGKDRGPNPVEHLLNALAGCLTGALVYHAAARGIEVKEVESRVEGDIDIQGFLGLKPDVRKGYQNIRVTFKLKTDAPEEKLRELASFSPVFDVVSNGTNVELNFEKK